MFVQGPHVTSRLGGVASCPGAAGFLFFFLWVKPSEALGVPSVLQLLAFRGGYVEGPRPCAMGDNKWPLPFGFELVDCCGIGGSFEDHVPGC